MKRASSCPSSGEVQARAGAAIAGEAARILEEGIAASPSDIDLVLIDGYGYPVWRGGPVFDADRVGLADVGLMCASNGVGFEPSPLFCDLAARGERFVDWAKRRGA